MLGSQEMYFEGQEGKAYGDVETATNF